MILPYNPRGAHERSVSLCLSSAAARLWPLARPAGSGAAAADRLLSFCRRQAQPARLSARLSEDVERSLAAQ
jgi:hypothetical protein